MKPEDIKKRIRRNELIFSTSRSSGPGGQNVNKVNTKVELRFKVTGSSSFNQPEKSLIMKILKNRISLDGDLLIISQSARTQLQNKINAEKTLFRLIAKALTLKPVRKATRPPKASVIKRLEKKRIHGRVKKSRKESGLHQPEE